MSKSLLVSVFIVLLVGLAKGDLDFAFAANVSGSVADNDWQYRAVELTYWSLLDAWSGANYASVEVDVTKSKATADYIAGACYVYVGNFPFSYIAHVNAEADFTFTNGSNGWATATNFAGGAGFVGHAFLLLVEHDPNGNIVAYQSLKSGFLVYGPDAGLQYSTSDHSKQNDTLKYVTFTGILPMSATQSQLSVSISYIASSVAGVLNQANTAVGPKNFESVIQIQNWNYASPQNSLTLYNGVGLGAAKVAGSGRTIVTKTDTTQVYYSSSSNAQVDGSLKGVKVTVSSNSTADINNQYFFNQLNAIYGASASYHTVSVSFPAGASNIIYDPSIGAGTPMDDPSAGFAPKSAAVGFLAFALAFLVVLC